MIKVELLNEEKSKIFLKQSEKIGLEKDISLIMEEIGKLEHKAEGINSDLHRDIMEQADMTNEVLEIENTRSKHMNNTDVNEQEIHALKRSLNDKKKVNKYVYDYYVYY